MLEEAGLEEAAVVAGVGLAEGGEAAAALARADVLEPGSVLTFVHPVVRTAVYQDLSAGERTTAHGRAALLLAERGAAPDRVAAHLLLAPTGAGWAVSLLRDAAGQAAALGAPAVAASYLERALVEVSPSPERVDLLIELGRAGLAAGLPLALDQLRQAVERAENPSQRTTAAVILARALR